MTCSLFRSEYLEAARTGAALSADASAHCAACRPCQDEWESQQALSQALGRMRAAYAGARSSEFRRARTRIEFGKLRRAPSLLWRRTAGAAAAAALVIAVSALMFEAPTNLVPPVAESGFVPVPYTAPLSEGEYLHVVETELSPAALAHLGFQVAFVEPVSADVVMGQDGMPRAVRLHESY